MSFLKIDKTFNTPYILVNPKIGIIEIKGRCIPENPTNFFNPITKFVSENFLNLSHINLHVQLDYINKSSRKELLVLIAVIKKLNSIKNNIVCFGILRKKI